MRQKLTNIKWLQYLMILITMLIFLPINTSAEKLPEGVVIGDNDGINARKNGEYFVQLKDIRPGQKWEKTISMMNMERDSSYTLAMQISPPIVSGPLDLSNEILMIIEYEGKILYDGPVSGISKDKNFQTSRVDFGTFNSGDSRALKVTYEMPDNYTNEDFSEKSKMENTWTFYAVKRQEETPPKKSGLLPQTGDIQKSMIMICLALFVTLIILFVWKNRNDNKQRS